MAWSDRFLNGSNPPDMDEAVKVYECSDCGEDICVGDTFFKFDEDYYCRDCAIKEFEHVAEIEDAEGERADIAYEQNVDDLRAQAYVDEL